MWVIYPVRVLRLPPSLVRGSRPAATVHNGTSAGQMGTAAVKSIRDSVVRAYPMPTAFRSAGAAR